MRHYIRLFDSDLYFDALVATLRTLKTLKGPQLLHVITTKGKGYELAEGDQIGYHAVSPFDPSQGVVSKPGARKPTYTDVFGDWLCCVTKFVAIRGRFAFRPVAYR